MTTGEKIKALRQQAGLSQSQLAEELHVSRAAIAKWENENGMPDVTNLKALAEFFHSDVDVLLDETKPLEADKKEEARLNPNTYCGQYCETCAYREKLSCPGCKLGPGNPTNGSCEIAKCCRNHRKNNCEYCSIKQHCGMASKAKTFPEKWDKKRQQEQLYQLRLQRQAPFYGKWLWILFWLSSSVCATTAVIVGLGFVNFSLIPIGFAARFLCQLGYSLILLYMSRENDRFKTAGILYLIQALGTAVISAQFPRSINEFDAHVVILVMMASDAAYTVGSYHENMGYAESLAHLNDKLSVQWKDLWKAHIILLCVADICVGLGAVFSPMIVFAVLCYVGILVVAVYKCIYLYRMRKYYKNAI